MKGLSPCVSEEARVGARWGKHAGLKQDHSRVKHERKDNREGDTCANLQKFLRNTIKTDEWADKPRHTVSLTKSPTQEAPISSGPLRSARSHWASRSCSSGPRFTLISPDTLSRRGWGRSLWGGRGTAKRRVPLPPLLFTSLPLVPSPGWSLLGPMRRSSAAVSAPPTVLRNGCRNCQSVTSTPPR